MNLMPLATLLENAGLCKAGETLFVDMMPAEAESAVLLRNPLSGTFINHELPGYFQTEFQVIVRTPAISYDAGKELITEVVAELTMTEVTLEDHWFQYCRPMHEPAVFPLSVGNMLEFSVKMETCFSRS